MAGEAAGVSSAAVAWDGNAVSVAEGGPGRTAGSDVHWCASRPHGVPSRFTCVDAFCTFMRCDDVQRRVRLTQIR